MSEMTVNGKIIREDPDCPQDFQIFWRQGKMLGSAPIAGGAGFKVQYDMITVNPLDYQIFVTTHKHRPDAPTSKTGYKRLTK